MLRCVRTNKMSCNCTCIVKFNSHHVSISSNICLYISNRYIMYICFITFTIDFYYLQIHLHFLSVRLPIISLIFFSQVTMILLNTATSIIFITTAIIIINALTDIIITLMTILTTTTTTVTTTNIIH